MQHRLYEAPFPHCVISDVISHETAIGLRRWLKGLDCWQHKTEHFFEHYGLDLGGLEPTTEWATVCSRPFLFALRRSLGRWFGVELAPDVRLWAHWLTNGQGIGVHNDNAPGEYRLVLQLNDDWKPEDGGYTLLLSGRGVSRIEKVIAPRWNTAIAFATDQHSFHAVSEVKSGDRYSLVFVFRELRHVA